MPSCCGLVMKEDITQRGDPRYAFLLSCGLVMKEDITQHNEIKGNITQVVVW